jgi:hypothetical protein
VHCRPLAQARVPLAGKRGRRVSTGMVPGASGHAGTHAATRKGRCVVNLEPEAPRWQPDAGRDSEWPPGRRSPEDGTPPCRRNGTSLRSLQVALFRAPGPPAQPDARAGARPQAGLFKLVTGPHPPALGALEGRPSDSEGGWKRGQSESGSISGPAGVRSCPTST